MKIEIRKNIRNMSQVPPNQVFMHEKVQKEDFLKKVIARIEIFFVVLGSYESLKDLER